MRLRGKLWKDCFRNFAQVSSHPRARPCRRCSYRRGDRRRKDTFTRQAKQSSSYVALLDDGAAHLPLEDCRHSASDSETVDAEAQVAAFDGSRYRPRAATATPQAPPYSRPRADRTTPAPPGGRKRE